MSKAIRSALAVYAFAVLASLALAAWRPIGFVRANSTVEAGPGASPPPIVPRKSLDVEEVLSSIPADGSDEVSMVWDVDPDTKYQRTIVEGEGNCSNLAFGLARGLQRAGIDYQVVHIVTPEGLFTGDGHTIVRTRYHFRGSEETGIVDLSAGGLPTANGRTLDIDAFAAPVEGLEFIGWGGRPELARHFYEDDMGHTIGWVPADQIERYFHFLDRYYVPLGNRRLEKYLFDGAALLFGVYPRLFVADIETLRAPLRVPWTFFQIAFWVFRGAIVVTPLLMLSAWYGRRARSPAVISRAM